MLVVYTHGVAASASSTKSSKPFSSASKRSNYNNAYEYFLEVCAQNNLRAAFTTSRDLNKDGGFNSYWLFQKRQWVKVNKKCRSQLIFDKFSPINKKQEERRTLLFSNPKIKSFNSPTLFPLFFDKQKTYEKLRDFTIPTVAIEKKDQKSIKRALNTLKILVSLHPKPDDFSNRLIMKDRFGSGGCHIYAIGPDMQKAEIFKILQKHKKTSFVIQPFTKFEKGFSYKNYSGFIDIRTIYLRNKIVQVYIRIAKENDFRCNEHQGGILEYIPKKDLPKKISQFSNKIVGILNEKNSLFALDFVIANSGNVYLMEGNNGPGIDWNLSLLKNERMAKKLIRLIVAELVKRAKKDFVPKKAIFPQKFDFQIIPHIIPIWQRN